jgi:adenylate kinase
MKVRDKQDVLAMCALQFASLQEVKVFIVKIRKEIEHKLKEMNSILFICHKFFK